jgi:hypothetical protein
MSVISLASSFFPRPTPVISRHGSSTHNLFTSAENASVWSDTVWPLIFHDRCRLPHALAPRHFERLRTLRRPRALARRCSPASCFARWRPPKEKGPPANRKTKFSIARTSTPRSGSLVVRWSVNKTPFHLVPLPIERPPGHETGRPLIASAVAGSDAD